MSYFLRRWEAALEEAVRTGKPVEIYQQSHMLSQPKLIGRTMHPSFMGVKPPKHDPERDK